MIRYYCSGFDTNNAFGHGLGVMFKQELKIYYTFHQKLKN